MNLPNTIPISGPPQVQELQRQINALRDYCRALTPRISPTVRPDMSAIGTAYEVNIPFGGAETNPDIFDAVIMSVGTNSLSCKLVTFSGSSYSLGDEITVQMPPTIRQSDWDGLTIDGKAYSVVSWTTYNGNQAQIRNAGGILEQLFPAYNAEPSTLETGETGDLNPRSLLKVFKNEAGSYEDLNQEARNWKNLQSDTSGAALAKVVSVSGNYYVCVLAIQNLSTDLIVWGTDYVFVRKASYNQVLDSDSLPRRKINAGSGKYYFLFQAEEHRWVENDILTVVKTEQIGFGTYAGQQIPINYIDVTQPPVWNSEFNLVPFCDETDTDTLVGIVPTYNF